MQQSNHYGITIREENNHFIVEHYESASGQGEEIAFPTLEEAITSITLCKIRCNECNHKRIIAYEVWDNFLYQPGGGLLYCNGCNETHDEFSLVERIMPEPLITLPQRKQA